MELDRDHGITFIRNYPVMTKEVIRVQEETGGQLFDESCFSDPVKKVACAQVIFALDTEYVRQQERLKRDPEVIDIGDPSWIYFPIEMFKSNPIITVIRTKDKPAGFVAWFRARKVYKSATVSSRRHL